MSLRLYCFDDLEGVYDDPERVARLVGLCRGLPDDAVAASFPAGSLRAAPSSSGTVTLAAIVRHARDGGLGVAVEGSIRREMETVPLR